MIHENLSSGDKVPKWSVLLTGDYLHREFERPLAWLDQHCQVTRVLSLFTFCPPGPLEREKVNEISLSGIDRFELIRTIFPSTH